MPYPTDEMLADAGAAELALTARVRELEGFAKLIGICVLEEGAGQEYDNEPDDLRKALSPALEKVARRVQECRYVEIDSYENERQATRMRARHDSRGAALMRVVEERDAAQLEAYAFSEGADGWREEVDRANAKLRDALAALEATGPVATRLAEAEALLADLVEAILSAAAACSRRSRDAQMKNPDHCPGCERLSSHRVRIQRFLTPDPAGPGRKVKFQFDERSLESVAKLTAQGRMGLAPAAVAPDPRAKERQSILDRVGWVLEAAIRNIDYTRCDGVWAKNDAEQLLRDVRAFELSGPGQGGGR